LAAECWCVSGNGSLAGAWLKKFDSTKQGRGRDLIFSLFFFFFFFFFFF